MTIASVGTLASGQSKAGGATLSFAAGTASVGDLIVIIVAKDNLATTDGNSIEISSIACNGNSFTPDIASNNGQAGAGAGAHAEIWHCILTVAITSANNIVVTWQGTAPTAAAASAWRFTITPNATISQVGSNSNQPDASVIGASCGVGSGSPTQSTLAIRAEAVETALVANMYSAATAGWTLFTQNGTTAGGAATNMCIVGEWIIFTGAAPTSDPAATTSADSANAGYQLSEVLPLYFPKRQNYMTYTKV